MNKNILIIGTVGIVALGAAYFFSQSSQESPQEEMMPEEHSMMGEHTIVFSGTAYSPREITIKKGDKVTFRNDSEREMWPASAMHPSHAVYPGSSIGKCDTEEEDQIFDACRRIASGTEWSFVFDQVGAWFYHDHLMPEANGKITVQE